MSTADNTPTKHRVIGVPWRPGESGNPLGRPKGARGKLSEDFLSDLHSCWSEHGTDALARVARDQPEVLLKIIASLLPRNVDLSVTGTVDVAGFASTFRAALAALHGEQQPPLTLDHEADRR